MTHLSQNTNQMRTFRYSNILFQCFATFLLQRNLPQIFALLTEPYAMIQATTALNRGCEFRPRPFQSVSAEPLAATRGTLRFRETAVEKH